MRYRLEDLEIDLTRRVVRRGDQTIPLPDLSFDMLAKLVQVAPEVVSFDALARDVWQAEHVSSETIAQRVALLRKALGAGNSSVDYVRTARGAGYAIAAGVTCLGREDTTQIGFAAKLAFVGAAAVLLIAGFALLADLGAPVPSDKTSDALATPSQQSTNAILLKRAREQLSLHQAKETDKAIALLREALKSDPDHFATRMALSAALSTKTTKFGGGYELEKEAEALARALISEQPSNSNAWSALAYALGSQGRMDESSSAYEYAYQLDPTNAMAMSSAAHNLLIRGELQQALALEMRAKDLGGTNKYAEIQIAQIFELIDHPDAKTWQDRALALNPGQMVILSELAQSHLRQGNPEAAINVLRQAEGEDRTAPKILQLRARAALMLGNTAEALSLFQATGDYAHKEAIALRAHLGEVALARDFLAAYDAAKLAGDTWPGSHVKMAEVAAAAGEQADAIQYLTHAVSLGWRDINWLQQSPFLATLMATPEGVEVIDRIKRELALQRRLIEGML